MFRKALSFGGLLLLAGAVVLATPGLSQAQRGGGHGGGGHGGGGHIGGGHIGGGHVGSGRIGGGNFGGANFRGGRIGGFQGSTRFEGSRRFGAFPRSRVFTYPYYGSSYYPYAYDTYPYAWPSSTYDGGYSSSSSNMAPSYADGTSSVAPPTVTPQSFVLIGSGAATEPGHTAHVTVNAPADAEVWFDGTKTTSTGPVRQYQSPSLEPGGSYHYEIRARWKENGQEVDQTRKVEVTAGSQTIVNFWATSKTTGQVSSSKEP